MSAPASDGRNVHAGLVVLVAGTLIAAAIDVRCRKIPNALTATMAVAAVALQIPNGTAALVLALAAMFGSFALGALAFSAGWLGGGDVKLIAAACGLVSYPGCIPLVTFILVAGAILALAQAARRGRLVTFVRNASIMAMTGSPSETTTLLPYGVAIAGGSIAYAASTLFPAIRLPL